MPRFKLRSLPSIPQPLFPNPFLKQNNLNRILTFLSINDPKQNPLIPRSLKEQPWLRIKILQYQILSHQKYASQKTITLLNLNTIKINQVPLLRTIIQQICRRTQTQSQLNLIRQPLRHLQHALPQQITQVPLPLLLQNQRPAFPPKRTLHYHLNFRHLTDIDGQQLHRQQRRPHLDLLPYKKQKYPKNNLK